MNAEERFLYNVDRFMAGRRARADREMRPSLKWAINARSFTATLPSLYRVSIGDGLGLYPTTVMEWTEPPCSIELIELLSQVCDGLEQRNRFTEIEKVEIKVSGNDEPNRVAARIIENLENPPNRRYSCGKGAKLGDSVQMVDESLKEFFGMALRVVSLGSKNVHVRCPDMNEMFVEYSSLRLVSRARFAAAALRGLEASRRGTAPLHRREVDELVEDGPYIAGAAQRRLGQRPAHELEKKAKAVLEQRMAESAEAMAWGLTAACRPPWAGIEDLPEGTGSVLPNRAELRELTGCDSVELDEGPWVHPWGAPGSVEGFLAVLLTPAGPETLRLSCEELNAETKTMGNMLPPRKRMAQAARSLIIEKTKALRARKAKP